MFDELYFSHPSWNGLERPAKCNATIKLPCIQANEFQDLCLNGSLLCKGGQCQGENVVWYLLDAQGNSIDCGDIKNSLHPENGSQFEICIKPSILKADSNYVIVLKGTCGSKECECRVQFSISPCGVCDCKSTPKPTFKDQVNKGFLIGTNSINCARVFKPIALCPNDKVEWQITRITPNSTVWNLPSTLGNQAINFTFPTNGVYNVCMYVKRISVDSCQMEYCKRINASCGGGTGGSGTGLIPCPVDNKIGNSKFSVGTQTGSLKSGAVLDSWELIPNIQGDVIVFKQGASNDGQAIFKFNSNSSSGLMQRLNPFELGFVNYGFEVFNYGSNSNVNENSKIELSLYNNAQLSGQAIILDTIVIDSSYSGWTNISKNVGRNITPDYIYFVVKCIGGSAQEYSYIGIDNLELCQDRRVATNDYESVNGEVEIIPNPNNGEFEINLQHGLKSEVEGKIISMDGKTIMLFQIPKRKATFKIKANELESGVYILRLFDGKNYYSNKFVKQ